jgi:hypothetical protein
MKLKKIGGPNDFLDMVIEAKLSHMVDISITAFKSATSTDEINGEKLKGAFESQNFGYLVTESGKVYRC